MDLNGIDIQSLVDKIEVLFAVKKRPGFRQTTYQFFLDDWTKQTVFPRIRNEEDGRTTLAVKVKIPKQGNFFERNEFETEIADSNEVMGMMLYFGFNKKVSWEKQRHAFEGGDGKVIFCLDETPIGWFLEIEGDKAGIEKAISKLSLENAVRIAKSYLGLWEDYKKEHALPEEEQMLFGSLRKSVD